MPHSNQIREFVMTDNGIELIDPYIGPAGVFMGSAKIAQEMRDKVEILEARRNLDHKQINAEGEAKGAGWRRSQH